MEQLPRHWHEVAGFGPNMGCKRPDDLYSQQANVSMEPIFYHQDWHKHRFRHHCVQDRSDICHQDERSEQHDRPNDRVAKVLLQWRH